MLCSMRVLIAELTIGPGKKTVIGNIDLKKRKYQTKISGNTLETVCRLHCQQTL